MTIPTKWQIAQHWAGSAEREALAPMLQDIGEPCCFACGWYSEHWDKVTPRASWERATLERAHVVPRSLGGTDDTSNIILLCSPCHRESPDWHEPGEMVRWIATRPDRCSKEVEELGDWCRAMQDVPEFQALLAEYEAAPDMPDDVAIQRIVGMLWESTRRAGMHASELSYGTKAAILRDAAARAASGAA